MCSIDKIAVLSFVILTVTLFVSTTQAQSVQDTNLKDEEVLKEFASEIRKELRQLDVRETILRRQLDALTSQAQGVAEEKRSHVQCLVNLIACYKKRK